MWFYQSAYHMMLPSELRQVLERVNLGEREFHRVQRRRLIMSQIVKTFLLVILNLLILPSLTNIRSSFVIHASPISSNLSPISSSFSRSPITQPQPSNAVVMINSAYRHHQLKILPQQNHQQHQAQQLIVCQLPPHMSSQTQCRSDQEQSFKRTAVAETQLMLQFTTEDIRSLLQSYMDEFRDYFVDLVYVSKNKSLTLFNQATPPSFLTNSMQVQGTELTRHLFETITSYLKFARSSYLAAPSASSSPHHRHHYHHHHQRPYQHSNQHSADSSKSSSYIDINHEIDHYFRQMRLITIQQHITTYVNHYERHQEPYSDCINESLSINNLDLLIQDQEDHLGMDTLNERLPAAIKQSLDSAHTLLDALALSTEIFYNLTQQASTWMPHDSCHSALARMLVCPNCYNHQQYQQSNSAGPHVAGPPPSQTTTAPCENFCLNVLRGCMNDVYELDKFWTDHVMGIQRLKMNMIQTNNIENVFTILDEKIQQMIKMNSLPEVSKHILERASAKCANTRTRRSPLLTAPAPISGPLLVQPVAAQLAPLARGQLAALAQTSPLLSLFNRLDGFVHELQQTRSFFASWPERICEHLGAVPAESPTNGQQQQDHIMPYQHDQPHQNGTSCWNGRDYATYKANLVQFGQIGTGNPEIQRPNEPFNAVILNIIAKLKDVGSQLSRKNTRSSAASIYNEGGMGKYGHSSSLHHRNGLINDYDYQQQQHQPNTNHRTGASSENTSSEPRDQDQDGAHHEPLIVGADLQQTNNQPDSKGNSTSKQPADANYDSSVNKEEDEEEDVADDVEGSGDYYIDDYPDDEQDDVCCEGDDSQQQQPGSLLDQDPPRGVQKFPPWNDQRHPSLPPIDNNQNNLNNFEETANRWTDNQYRSDTIDKTQPGFMLSHQPRYTDAGTTANNKQVGSSAPSNSACLFMLMAMTVITSCLALLPLSDHTQRKKF